MAGVGEATRVVERRIRLSLRNAHLYEMASHTIVELVKLGFEAIQRFVISLSQLLDPSHESLHKRGQDAFDSA